MKQVTNHNRDWVIYKMSFRLEPDTDPQHVEKVVKKVSKELAEHPEHGSKFIEPLKSQGVYGIDDDSALIIRVKFMSKPRAQFILRREVYHRLQTAFSEAGVQFARRKVEVVASGGQGANSAPQEMVQAAAEAIPDAVTG
ncbi:MAG: mechanosensitive ion channel family protein, partial [Pseudomonadota bacterium]